MATTGGDMDFMLGGAHVVSFWILYCKTPIQHWYNIWYCKVFFLHKLTLLPPDNGVMGRCLSVSLSGGGGCPPCDHYPWCTAFHCTGSPPDMGPSLETCSNLSIPPHCTGPTTPPKYWHLVATEARTVGQYVSYWIAFFFTGCICNFLKKK